MPALMFSLQYKVLWAWISDGLRNHSWHGAENWLDTVPYTYTDLR